MAKSTSMATDKPKIQAYVAKNYRDAFEVLCKKQARSVSNGVEWLIIQAVDQAIKNGDIPAEILTDQNTP
ncbi:hypothetical protein D0962_15395 [Leptolyngbyaceae cyanobacterium CCMR0082]|uniref:Uncharacterized protein n=1 Tax=Adonisia turfae CCMR0082 TaxID=2304604 RepID=A0A6M0S6Q2_9CYAN|nr:hypothetical protein [Adonisia turfae]NEZ64158.1 hypothetical protein [Adonisia turfae CCMR0082]